MAVGYYKEIIIGDFYSHEEKSLDVASYIEAFLHVLSDSEASETYGYLVWIILDLTPYAHAPTRSLLHIPHHHLVSPI